MKLQRLVYPDSEPSIPRKTFGSSAGKFYSMTEFFTCAARGAADTNNGEIQAILDNLYAHRGTAVSRRIAFQAPQAKEPVTLFSFGEKTKLVSFGDNISAVAKAHIKSGTTDLSSLKVADGLLLDFLLNANPDKTEEGQRTTMGWLDVESGCFALKSMASLNRVRELFGKRPHVALRKQNSNYRLDWA